jgi:hypothetical protein
MVVTAQPSFAASAAVMSSWNAFSGRASTADQMSSTFTMRAASTFNS